MLRWIEAAARLRRSGFSRPRRSGRQPLALPRPRRGRGTGGGRGRGCRERCAWADAGACRPGAGQVDPRPWGGPRADRRGDEHRRARPTEGGAGRPHAARRAGRARRGDPHQPADRHRARPRPGAGRSDATGGPGGRRLQWSGVPRIVPGARRRGGDKATAGGADERSEKRPNGRRSLPLSAGHPGLCCGAGAPAEGRRPEGRSAAEPSPAGRQPLALPLPREGTGGAGIKRERPGRSLDALG